MYSGRAFSHGFPCRSQSSASSTYDGSVQGRDKMFSYDITKYISGGEGKKSHSTNQSTLYIEVWIKELPPVISQAVIKTLHHAQSAAWLD